MNKSGTIKAMMGSIYEAQGYFQQAAEWYQASLEDENVEKCENIDGYLELTFKFLKFYITLNLYNPIP